MKRFRFIADLTDAKMLGQLIGPVTGITTATLSGIGFSGSTLYRVGASLETGNTRNFILKETSLNNDWLSLRSHDPIGRETALLEEDKLAKVWNVIHCSYVAFAREKDRTGLLMDDLSEYLFPDTREPIDVTSEDIIIDKITSIHALFWDSNEIRKLSWIARPIDYLSMLGPREHKEDDYCPPPEKLRSNISEGWKLALQLLPSATKNVLTKPAEEIFEPWKDLPVTLLHGDLKIANMAILPGNKLALFDWPATGRAPCSMELGWYLAVNATRLARTKEEFINKYRSLLESHLQFSIDENTWHRMKKLAVVTGAMMLLWNKALGWRSGTQKGKDEWEWWKDQLQDAIT
jgi:thiamine kinase-like enzyme